MPQLERCRNASHEDWTVGRQIQAIQESMLFLGCHSGPQHLAVACGDTPVIVTNYTVAPSCTEMGSNIAKTSNEPVGSQVRAVLYNRMWDAAGHELLPSPSAPAARIVSPSVDEVLAVVRGALGDSAGS